MWGEHSCPHCGTNTAGLAESLAAIDKKLEKIMTDQDTANELAQEIEADVTQINANVQTALTEIAELEEAAANGQPLDFTKIKQALTDLDSSTAGTASVDAAAAPAQPPAPAPAS